jgi:hypothetical protein
VDTAEDHRGDKPEQVIVHRVQDRITLGAAPPVEPWEPQRLENGELVDIPPPWWPAGKPKYRGVVKESEKKSDRKWRAIVMLGSGSGGAQVPAARGRFKTEYEAALAVVAKSREMQAQLPWTIPDNVATLPNWIVLTYTCPICGQVMQTDPLEGIRACSLHTRECREANLKPTDLPTFKNPLIISVARRPEGGSIASAPVPSAKRVRVDGVAAPRRRTRVERFDPLVDGLSDIAKRMRMASALSTDERFGNDRERKARTVAPDQHVPNGHASAESFDTLFEYIDTSPTTSETDDSDTDVGGSIASAPEPWAKRVRVDWEDNRIISANRFERTKATTVHDYIIERCREIDGLTVSRALETLVLRPDGTRGRYARSDLNYDIVHQNITLHLVSPSTEKQRARTVEHCRSEERVVAQAAPSRHAFADGGAARSAPRGTQKSPHSATPLSPRSVRGPPDR